MQVVNAIILKSAPFTENQRILRLFSAERGFLSLITPDTLHKRQGSTAVQCMQIVEVEYTENTRGGIHKLKSIRPECNTNAIYLDIFKMNIALLWGEVLCLILRHEERNEPLYDYLRQSVEYLSAAGEDAANFNLFFLYRLCGLLGFRIETSTYRPGYLFDPGAGRFCPPPAPSGALVGPRAARTIYQLCNDPLLSIRQIPLNREGRGMLLDVVLLFLGYHLNLDFNTKSIRVIREIFAGSD
jgi:DNA repair protein RecO (recombination protein O)